MRSDKRKSKKGNRTQRFYDKIAAKENDTSAIVEDEAVAEELDKKKRKKEKKEKNPNESPRKRKVKKVLKILLILFRNALQLLIHRCKLL